MKYYFLFLKFAWEILKKGKGFIHFYYYLKSHVKFIFHSKNMKIFQEQFILSIMNIYSMHVGSIRNRMSKLLSQIKYFLSWGIVDCGHVWRGPKMGSIFPKLSARVLKWIVLMSFMYLWIRKIQLTSFRKLNKTQNRLNRTKNMTVLFTLRDSCQLMLVN